MKIKKAKKVGRPPLPASEKRTYSYLIRLSPIERKVLLKVSKDQRQTPAQIFRSNLISIYGQPLQN